MAREGVRVDSVSAEGLANKAGIRSGDRILSVSGEPVEDLIDLHFLTSKTRFTLRWRSFSGKTREKAFRASGTPLGIIPEPVRVRRCRNRCIFCFVHQLPAELRPALYVKDEDVRLSFLHGQYVTFSDLSEGEIRKILAYRLSPLYVSIHTTSPELRRRMLGNPRARDVMEVMRRLTREGIVLHGQIVVCPEINDGEELSRTLRELSVLHPGLRTVAVVPVGLTSHRAGLPPLRPVTMDEARETLGRINDFRRGSGRGTDGEPFAMPADEYYLLAGRKVPGRKAYGSFPQLGNGVGLLRSFLDDSKGLFRRKRWPDGASGGTVVTGIAAREYVARFLEKFSGKSGVPFRLVPVPNRMLGESVTVTGLLSGRDILSALGRNVQGPLYIPSVTLRDAGDVFLDGLTPGEISRGTGAEVRMFEPTPRAFRESVYAGKPPLNR